ncbi:hypothetical protein SprV_0301113600 [Sparganum proliferum]
MRTLSPVPPRSSASPSFLEKDLATCSHVYLRCGRLRRPLEPPYDGPFRVLSRGPKAFRIQRDNREEVVSVDRLKAAVPDTPPGEPCGPLPSASPMQPLFHRPVFSLCPPARHLRLPPPTPTLPPPDVLTLLRTLYISLAVVVMYTFLIGWSLISFGPVHILRRRFRRPPVSEVLKIMTILMAGDDDAGVDFIDVDNDDEDDEDGYCGNGFSADDYVIDDADSFDCAGVGKVGRVVFAAASAPENNHQGVGDHYTYRERAGVAVDVVGVCGTTVLSVARRCFLVDSGVQISIVPPTPADRRFPSPGLRLQAANCSPNPTFGSLSFTLHVGLRRTSYWIFVIADIPHVILGSDFLVELNLPADADVAVSSTVQFVSLFTV